MNTFLFLAMLVPAPAPALAPVVGQINVTWYLLPLAAVISLVYKATRYEDPHRILTSAGRLFIQILVFMTIILGVLVALSFRL